jgi:hypothetical protein
MVTRLLATQPESAQAADPFKGFEIERVLSDSDRTKTMAVLGRCAFLALHLLYPLAYVLGARLLHRWSAKPEKAVLLLSRRPFHQSGVQAMLDSSPNSELQFQNDIYAKVQTYISMLFLANFLQTMTMLDQCHELQYTSTLAPDQGAITVDTIYPASEKHIRKHTMQKFLMVSRHQFKACKRRKHIKTIRKFVSTFCFDVLLLAE